MGTSAIPSTFSSGMTESFQKVLPPKTPASSSNPTQTPNTGKLAPGLSRPANSIPNKPNQVTTSGTPTPQAQAAAPSAAPPQNKAPAKVPFSINLANAGSLIGSAINTGQGVYNAYQNSALPMLGHLQNYLKDPTNFANTLGMLSPIASPLMRTAGLPLLFGAYSALKDKNYLNDLTGGRFPKLAAVVPPAPAAPTSSFDFKPDPAFRITSAPEPVPANPIPVIPTTQPKTPEQVRDLTNVGIGAGTTAASIGAGSKAVVKNPFIRANVSPVFSTVGNIAELAGVPERVAGMQPRSFDEISKGWYENSMNVGDWLKRYHQIYNDPNSGPIGKSWNMVLNSIGNPWWEAYYNPIQSSVVAAKGINDWTGAGNLVHHLSGGKYGQPASGDTLSVPAAVGQMMHLRYGKGKEISQLHR